jgi:adenine-specific DNA-methyltransferase
MHNTDLKRTIQSALLIFPTMPLAGAANSLLKTLGYRSEKQLTLVPNSAAQFQAELDPQKRLSAEKDLMNEWQSVDLLFQITDEEIQGAMQGQAQLFTKQKVDNTVINSYLFFAVDLMGKAYTRTQ